MKITKPQLRQIIKEEVEVVLSERATRRRKPDYPTRSNWRKVLTGEMQLEDFKKQVRGWPFWSLRYPTIECLDGGPCPEGKKAWEDYESIPRRGPRQPEEKPLGTSKTFLSEEDGHEQKKIHPMLIKFLKIQLDSHKIKTKDGSEITVAQAIKKGQPLEASFDEFIVSWQQMYNGAPHNKNNLRLAVSGWLEKSKAYK